ncbi:MAG: hypothetical protein ACK4K7_06725 [Allosphingosinicella sp.]|uniref:hypothetical protein n=1 Tax=Allosphingosinicella sp. TaxID=2823234 RepID=UPI0039308419
MHDFLFSPSTGGFYLAGVSAAVPEDAAPVSARRYEALMKAQSQGRTIGAGRHGRPVILPRARSRLAELRALAIDRVKREAGRRILAVAPIWRQANDNAAIAEAALQFALQDPEAPGSTVDFVPALERRRAIDALRAASDALEATVAAMDRAALANFQPSLDEHWS